MNRVAIGMLIVAITGIVAAIAIRNLLTAIDRGAQRRIVADLRSISSAVEAYRVDTTIYPTAMTVAALQAVVVPRYIRAMPTMDSWGNAFQVESSNTHCTLYSRGRDGLGNNCMPGQTSSIDDEICFVSGVMTRYPEGSAP